MTRDEAASLVQAFFEAQGASSPDLTGKDAGGAMFGSAELFFQYQPEQKILKCLALIYRFRVEPKERVMDALKREELTKAAHAEDAELEYQPENRGLYLTREYQERVASEQFNEEIRRLAETSLAWADKVLDRLASQIFHPEEISG